MDKMFLKGVRKTQQMPVPKVVQMLYPWRSLQDWQAAEWLEGFSQQSLPNSGEGPGQSGKFRELPETFEQFTS